MTAKLRSVRPTSRTSDDAEWKCRVELAGAFRIANRLGWNEGIANHFSMVLPGSSADRFLLNPYELHFSEITASNLIIADAKGNLIEGKGQVRSAAFILHGVLHTHVEHATAIIHAHPPYSTAISCVKGGRLGRAHANAIGLAKQIVYDDEMRGVISDEECKRMVKLVGNRRVIFHAMHGLTTLGRTVADAYDAFYFTERWAMYTVLGSQLAVQQGKPMHELAEHILKDTPERDRGFTPPAAQAHFNAMLRQLDREEPDYKT